MNNVVLMVDCRSAIYNMPSCYACSHATYVPTVMLDRTFA